MHDPIPRIHSLARISRDSPRIEAAALAVLSDRAKLVFRGRTSSWSVAGEAFGVDLPRTINRFHSKGGRTVYCLGPDEWLLEAADEDPAGVYAALSLSLQSHACSLVDVSHRSDGLQISGPMSGYVLNHGCPLDLSEQAFPVGMCTRTVLGKAQIMLWRPERDSFRIDVWRSFAPYVWALLDEARQELRRPDDSARPN
jgi:sarcosine oxidase subunit gamma